jgi:hypothetical protein
LLIPARRGARSRGVARVGRGAVLQQASHACWQEALGSPVLVQVRLKVPRARCRPALPFHHPHRAGLPIAPPSIIRLARSASCGPTGAGSLTDTSSPQTSPHPSRQGQSCPGHPDPEKRGASPNRDHRDRSSDQVRGGNDGEGGRGVPGRDTEISAASQRFPRSTTLILVRSRSGRLEGRRSVPRALEPPSGPPPLGCSPQ